MYIHSYSSFFADPGTADIELMKEFGASDNETRRTVRRANRFILLSLIGAHRCVKNAPLPTHTAVYLASENGNLGDTKNIIDRIYNKKFFPTPFNFINTMSNTAAFYVAQTLNLSSRNIMVSHPALSCERALELLKTEMDAGMVHCALVGGVDEAVPDEEQFRLKFGFPPLFRLVAGSSWIYVTDRPEGADGEILEVRSFPDKRSCIAGTEHFLKSKGALVSFGIHITQSEKEKWLGVTGSLEEFNFFKDHGFYDSAACGAIATFLENRKGERLIHINKDGKERYAVIYVQSR